MKKEKPKKTNTSVEVGNKRITDVILPFLLVFGLTLTIFLAGSKAMKLNKSKASADLLLSSANISKDKIRESLEIANGTYLDPMTLIRVIDKNPSDMVIIDIRSGDDFNRGHIKSSINMSIDAIMKDYRGLRNKKVIVYGENSYDPVPKDVAIFLLGKRIDTRVLAVGWNEFRHFRNLWVPEGMWNKIDVNRYVSDLE